MKMNKRKPGKLNELAVAKMERMEEEMRLGKRKVYSESEVKRKLKI